MEFEIIIYICVIIFLLYRSFSDTGTSIIGKIVIFILCAHLFLYYFGNTFKSDDDSEPAHCKFMRELLDEDLLSDVTPDTVGENISREVNRLHRNLINITEKAYACNCESASEYMKDGKSLKEIYSSRCDNKCKQMDRPLTKCNSSDDCDFPFECFKYDDVNKIFEPHNSDSELGVCVLEGSTHHISDIIQIYQGVEHTSSHGDNIISYLSEPDALPFCHQPSTDLKKVIDFDEDNKHYVETDESQGHYCCLMKTFKGSDDFLDRALSFGSNFWDENKGAILSRVTLMLLTNLGIMGVRFGLALGEGGESAALAALEAKGVLTEGVEASRALRLIQLGKSIEYSKLEPISMALRWAVFGGRGGTIIGKFPGLFNIIRGVINFPKTLFGARGLAGVVLNILKDAGLIGEAAALRGAAATAAEGGSSAEEAIEIASEFIEVNIETTAEVGGEIIAEGVAEQAVERGAARIVMGAASDFLTGPVGLALLALQVAGAILDHYDVAGYGNLIKNKEILRLFDRYTGAFIDGMKSLPNGREPPYGVDIVSTFFDKSGEKLVWPFNRCSESGEEGCNVEYIKNIHDKEAAKAMIVIVGALKEAEDNEITEKMGEIMKNMTESIKDNQVYMDFLNEYQTALDSGPGNTETEKTATFLNGWMIDMITLDYTTEQAIERDRRYFKTILRKLNEKMPNLGYKYLGGANQDGNTLLEYSKLTGPEQLSLSNNDKDSPLIYFNKKFSPTETFGCGIQLTKRGVKLYNRYRNLKADPPQEYIAFSKKCLLIYDRNPIPNTNEIDYKLYQGDCHVILGIQENDYPGLAQPTMLNKLDHICRYGSEWGKEGASPVTSDDLRDTWIYMKNGSPDTTNQPFSASDRGPIDPCPWGCIEIKSKGEHSTEEIQRSSNNFNSRMMAYNYNIYMREKSDSFSILGDTEGGTPYDFGFEDNDNPINESDPKNDYSNWPHFNSVANDDWKEWRATALVGYLLDPDDAIDDDNYSCSIKSGREDRNDPTKSSYCNRMTGNDDQLVRGFHWGGRGNYNTNHNAPLDAWGGDPVSSGSRDFRTYNDCIVSEGQRWSENILGTWVVREVQRLFDWW